jgi:hypothetical protein
MHTPTVQFWPVSDCHPPWSAAAFAHVGQHRPDRVDYAVEVRIHDRPANEMAERIINWVLTGRGFRKRFGLDALSAPIAKQLLPDSVFFSGARRKFGM